MIEYKDLNQSEKLLVDRIDEIFIEDKFVSKNNFVHALKFLEDKYENIKR